MIENGNEINRRKTVRLQALRKATQRAARWLFGGETDYIFVDSDALEPSTSRHHVSDAEYKDWQGQRMLSVAAVQQSLTDPNFEELKKSWQEAADAITDSGKNWGEL